MLPLPGRYDSGGYTRATDEKPRSLSIQSLISSPGFGEDGTNRKIDADDNVRGARHGSLVPASVSIEDPDVREVVEALGGLKGGESYPPVCCSLNADYSTQTSRLPPPLRSNSSSSSPNTNR